MLVDEDEQAPPPQRINVRVLINSSLRLQEQKLTDCLDGSFCYAMHLPACVYNDDCDHIYCTWLFLFRFLAGCG